MSSQGNMQLVRKLFDIYNLNDLKKMEAFDTVLSRDVIFHDPAISRPKNGLMDIKSAESDYVKAFPNKVTTIEDITAVEDKVIVRWSATGTYKGPFHDLAPNNKKFKISGISIYRIENNKIAEIWQNWDRYGLMEQIGELRLASASF